MRSEENGSLAHADRRSREPRGLDAIFSAQKPRSEKELLTGSIGIIAGLLLLILAIFRTLAPEVLGPISDAVYSSLAFGAVGILLLICGGGTITFAIAQRKSNQSQPLRSERENSSSILGSIEAHTETRGTFGASSRIGALAFVQGLVLVVLYSGFVQEFESNTTMQIWLQSNFPVGQSVLNWEGVLVLAVFIGIVLLQFLPGRYFSD
jgi:hypothetical protein